MVFGRFDDLIADRALVFPAPSKLLVAETPDQIVDVLQAVSAASREGDWCFGYVGYEAAAGLDPLLTVSAGAPGDPPPAWFAVTGAPSEEPVIEPARVESRWRPAWGDDDYDAAISTVRQHIAAGDSYQVNLTSRLLGSVTGDPLDLYASLVHQQRGAHAAYLDIGSHVIASASPELFFSWDGTRITTRPMKGTARRGRITAEDSALRADLLASEKERAEHIIVVDLLRNDLGRIADFGSVRPPKLGVAERYESVWQLTSDIVADTRPGVDLLDIFTALFPCGSVTGAPKRRTMEIIAALEPAARGVYCGAIGFVAPLDSGCPRATFSVAIRTAVLCRASGQATYGVGGGITSGSNPIAERQELQAKSAILFSDWEDFSLIETLFWSPGSGPRNLDRHLARLADSAAYFGFPYSRSKLLAAVDTIEAEDDLRLRLRLDRSGSVTATTRPLEPANTRPVRLALDTVVTDSRQRWLFHKTTRREPYDRARARHGHADDVVLVNESGQVTETTIASIAVKRDGIWWTPPIEAGCLPGVERGRLVDEGILTIGDLSVAEVSRAEEIAVVSSLRGWRAAELIGPTDSRSGTPATRDRP